MSTRQAYVGELEDLRLQVELMGIKVDRNLERMRAVLEHGDVNAGEFALQADDDIDATYIALTNRCYEIMALQAPVATDLRLLVSVVRVTAEFERVGDLALRAVKVALVDHEQLREASGLFDILVVMADRATEAFRLALDGWSSGDLARIEPIVAAAPLAGLQEQLAGAVTRLTGRSAPQLAARAVIIGQALDRIGDHARVVAARVRYLLTADPQHLAAEVR